MIKHHSTEGEYFEIHGVYYDDQNLPVACTQSASTPYGDTVEELSACMIHMQSALTQPVIDAKIFENTTNSSHSINSALDLMKGSKDV